MKKKIIALLLCAAMLAVAVIAGTLAYFTDTDSADNTFTIGNVKIELKENFDPTDAVLVPGKDINKDVWVKNTGAQNAYVRVHFAIPAAVDDGDPSLDASKNFLHWNFTADAVAAGQWSFIPYMTTGTGYLGNGTGNWNFYTTKIDGVDYNVYIITYRTALAAGEETDTYAITKVYLDKSVDAVQNADGTITYKDNKGNTITMDADDTLDIKVFAEGVQAEGFDDAYAAFKAAFGDPSSTNNPWAE